MNPGNQHQTEVDESQLDSLTKALNANLNKPVQTQQTADGVSFFTLPEEVCPLAPPSSSKPVQTQQPTDGVFFFTLPEDTEAAIHTVKAVKRFAQKDSLKHPQNLDCVRLFFVVCLLRLSSFQSEM